MTVDVKKPEKGSVYLRGGTYWVKYYKWGKPYRESADTDNYDKALRFLKFKLKQIELGRFVEPRLERTLVESLWEPFKSNLERKHAKDTYHAEMRWDNHLKPFFVNMRIVDVTGTRLNEYVSERQGDKVKDSTIIRELAVLKRMFKVGYKSDPPTVLRVPPFPELKESPARQGFLADADYTKLANECAKEGLWLRAMLAVFYSFGWRKSELLNLRVRQVDLKARTIRLDAGTTKNNRGRLARMTEEVHTLLTACIERKQPEDYVFTRGDDRRVKDFRKTWKDVCERAGVPGLLVHDLRRTGARNLRRLGLAENTIMAIGGWKTNAVFKRYDIVSEDDLAEAARRLDEKRRLDEEKQKAEAPAERSQSEVWAQFGHNLTTAPASGKLSN